MPALEWLEEENLDLSALEDPPDENEEAFDAPEDFAAQRSLPSPQLPSQSLIDDQCITHMLYRSWCRECVEGRGRETAHSCVDQAGRSIATVALYY